MAAWKRMARDESKLEMTPMIDVTFLLLIFFMCTLKFKTLEGLLAATLPRDVGRNAVVSDPLERTTVVVRVVEPGSRLLPDGRPAAPGWTGRTIAGPDRRVDYSVGPYRTGDLGALEAHLTRLHTRLATASPAEVEAKLEARPGTSVEEVVEVLDRMLDAGFRNVAFVGAPGDLDGLLPGPRR